MFHFPAFPPHTLYIQVRVTGHDPSRVPPFGHPRITARLPAPRGFSQATTSFFGSWCQGIHPVPLQTSTTLRRYQEHQHADRSAHRFPETSIGCSRPLYSSQATDGLTGTPAAPTPAPRHAAGRAEGGSTAPVTRVQDPRPRGRLPQDPTVCFDPAPHAGPGPTPRLRRTTGGRTGGRPHGPRPQSMFHP